MIQELPRVHSGNRFKVVTTQESVIQDLARQIAQSTQPIWGDQGRRSQPRVPLPRLIGLTPLKNDNLQPAREPTYVVGKNLAPLGLDFFHHEPIAERFAIVALERAPEYWVHLLMKITWCRFLKQGWYDSGGRFLKVVEWTSDE